MSKDRSLRQLEAESTDFSQYSFRHCETLDRDN